MSATHSSGPSQLQLVSSRRLRALRDKSLPATALPQNQPTPLADRFSPREDAETARLRRLVEQQLAQILATLPANMQRRLFKIRFGIDLDAFKTLPPQQAAKILKIRD